MVCREQEVSLPGSEVPYLLMPFTHEPGLESPFTLVVQTDDRDEDGVADITMEPVQPATDWRAATSARVHMPVRMRPAPPHARHNGPHATPRAGGLAPPPDRGTPLVGAERQASHLDAEGRPDPERRGCFSVFRWHPVRARKCIWQAVIARSLVCL